MIHDWLNHEIPNKTSLGGSLATAAIVGLAGNLPLQITLGAFTIWTALDLSAYTIKHEVQSQ